MDWVLWTVGGLLAAAILVGLIWRVASRRHSLPCPAGSTLKVAADVASGGDSA